MRRSLVDSIRINFASQLKILTAASPMHAAACQTQSTDFNYDINQEIPLKGCAFGFHTYIFPKPSLCDVDGTLVYLYLMENCISISIHVPRTRPERVSINAALTPFPPFCSRGVREIIGFYFQSETVISVRNSVFCYIFS